MVSRQRMKISCAEFFNTIGPYAVSRRADAPYESGRKDDPNDLGNLIVINLATKSYLAVYLERFFELERDYRCYVRWYQASASEF